MDEEKINCENCEAIVGKEKTLEELQGNPLVVFQCRICGQKTHIKNPYFLEVREKS